MIVSSCDGCGKNAKPGEKFPEFADVTYKRDSLGDLCPDCIEAIKAFLAFRQGAARGQIPEPS